ncbi:hypothetical protein [Lacrimispora brassicae]
MKKLTYGSLMIGIFFGCICYTVCSFFVDTYFSALLGLSTGIIYFLIFCIWGTINAKKQERILSEYGNDFLFNETVNYYSDNGLLNGLLVLTEETLFFIATEKIEIKIDYPLHQIAEIEFIKIFKHITGLSIFIRANLP